jgi:TolA-binding protein
MPSMKKSIAILLLALFAVLLAAQNKVEQIAVSYDNPIVSRVAMTLTQKTKWTYSVDTDNHQVTVTIEDCDASSPLIGGLSNSKLVTKIDLLNKYNAGVVVLTLSGPFYIETTSVDNPYKIVLDLFVYKKTYSYQDLLNQALFYEKSGYYAKAAKQYAKMQTDYPQNKDTNYYWGNLLLKQRKTDKAIEKLKLVPTDSKFYKTAQTSLQKLEVTDSEIPVPVAEPVAITDSVPADKDSLVVPVQPLKITQVSGKFKFLSFKTFFGVTWGEFLTSKFMLALFALPIWFWIIVGVVLIIIVLVIFDVLHLKKLRRKNRPPKAKKSKQLDQVKVEMVVKLLEHGWQEYEISRELLLTPKEVHQYIREGKKAIASKAKSGEQK